MPTLIIAIPAETVSRPETTRRGLTTDFSGPGAIELNLQSCLSLEHSLSTGNESKITTNTTNIAIPMLEKIAPDFIIIRLSILYYIILYWRLIFLLTTVNGLDVYLKLQNDKGFLC
jgi:hypothetical protein